MIYIYILTNKVNGKKYVGQTVNIKRRLREHKAACKNHPIAFAIKKYGWDNFEVEFFECFKEDVDVIECLLISFYETTNKDKGYNLDFGGSKNKKHSEKTKQKISESLTGKKHTEESIAKMSEACKGRKHSQETKDKLSAFHKGKKLSKETCKKMSDTRKKLVGELNPLYGRKGKMCPAYGKHHTEETKRKISINKKGKYSRGNSLKAIKVICIETGEVFDCIKDAGDKYKIWPSDISACCKGKHKTCGGYHWMYYKDYIKENNIDGV